MVLSLLTLLVYSVVDLIDKHLDERPRCVWERVVVCRYIYKTQLIYAWWWLFQVDMCYSQQIATMVGVAWYGTFLADEPVQDWVSKGDMGCWWDGDNESSAILPSSFNDFNSS